MDPKHLLDLPFAEYAAIQAINASGLKLLLRSPAHYRASLETPRTETAALRLGTAVHASVLEHCAFSSSYVVAPKVDRRTKEGKAAWADFETANREKTILSSDQYDSLRGMVASVLAHPSAAALLSGHGVAESTVLCEMDGVPAKARPDYLRQEVGVIADLKTTQDASESDFSRSVAKYAYHLQAAWYIDVCAQIGIEIENFAFIAAESAPPYAVSVFELEEEAVDFGRRQYRQALDVYLTCLETNRWPAYSDDVVKLALPSWAMRTAA